MPGEIGDFKELIESSRETELFVDKTLFIGEIANTKDPILITRPRRWGKTLNMSMLFYYFVHREQLKNMGKSDSYITECDDLFKKLNIFNKGLNLNLGYTKEFMGRYPVIFISFALSGDDSSKDDITKPDWNKIKGLIIGRIAELFAEFNYIAENLKKVIDKKFNLSLDQKIAEYKKQFNVENISDAAQIKIYEQVQIDKSVYPEQRSLEKFVRLSRGEPKNDTELSDSINFLAELLKKIHNSPVYIFVDEYDCLINKYFNNKYILENLTKTFSGIFSTFAKPNKSMNDYIQKVIFTGILRVAKANIFSGLNNLQDCTVLDETFSKYYGFTQEELNMLLDKAKENDNKDKVILWYNGYKMGKETIYNPWSVMQFLKKKTFEPHWIQTANLELIKDIVLNNKGHAINKLLRQVIKEYDDVNKKTFAMEVNKHVSVEDLKNPDSIWSFLIHTGYLTVETSTFNSRTGKYLCESRIPNKEISSIYNLIVYEWLNQQASIVGTITSLFEQDYENLADNLQRLLINRYDSALFARKEDSVEEVYHSLLLTELNKEILGANYALLPEEYSGNGRADILFVDNLNKIIIPMELKRTQKSNTLEKSAEEAVNQAVSKQYGNDPKYEKYEKRPAIGISFCGTSVAIKICGIKSIITRKAPLLKKRQQSKTFMQIPAIPKTKFIETQDSEDSQYADIAVKFQKGYKSGTTFMPNFSSMVTRSRNEKMDGKEVSKIYWYEDNDMLVILKSSITQYQNKTKDRLPIHILGPLDNVSTYSLKEALNAHNRQYGTILIPFNLGQLHWVGLVLEYDEDQNLIRADYYDPQENDIPDFLNIALQSISRTDDVTNKFKLIQDVDGLIRQTNGSDCGPCTIGNLLYAAGYREAANIDPVGHRLNHLRLLELVDPDYYRSFYERQRLNQSSFIKIRSAHKFDVSVHFGIAEYKALLLLTLNILCLPEKLQNNLKNSFKTEDIEGDKEHAEVIKKIRSVLKDHTKEDQSFQVIMKIFYVKDKTESLEDMPLKLDYNQIQPLSIMLDLPKSLIESDIKEIDQLSVEKISRSSSINFKPKQ